MMRLLLTGYPYLSLTDPDGYIANMISILCEYPKHVSQEAVRLVADHGGRHPPSRFDLRQRCQSVYATELKREIKLRQERAQIEERERLALGPPLEERRRIAVRFQEQLREIFPPDVPPDPEAERERVANALAQARERVLADRAAMGLPAEGSPTGSPALLRAMGWEVENISGHRVWVQRHREGGPPPPAFNPGGKTNGEGT